MKNHEHYSHDENVDRISDELLFDSYRHGDGHALAELHSRYRRELLSYLFRYMGNMELAEDAMQTTFLNASRNADSFDGTRKFKAWLYGIATNTAIDTLRKEKHHVHSLSLDESMGGEGTTHKDLLLSRSLTPDDLLIQSEEAAMIADGVESLQDQQKMVVRMIYFQGMKYREAAELLHIPIGTVKSRLAQAIKDLREWYEKVFGVLQPVKVASGGGRNRR